jgi:hypothetical protein
VLITATLACTPRDQAVNMCLGGSRPVTQIRPLQQGRYSPGTPVYLPDHTALDARGVQFDDSALDSSGYGVGVKIYDETGSRDDLCFVGGSIVSSLDVSSTPWNTWHQVAGLTELTADFTVVGLHLFNQGDGIVISGTGATNWRVIGVAADGGGVFDGAYIHDDCIENDSLNAGLVEDSKFDGCSSFLSSTGGAPLDGGQNLVEVSHTLVRLQSMYNSYNPTKYGYNQHSGFFKWAGELPTDAIPPQLYVHDSTFRADSPAAFGGNSNGMLGLPPNTRCNNVTLINTASWPARDLASWTSQCTNITFGTTADWNAAVTAWDQGHPTL